MQSFFFVGLMDFYRENLTYRKLVYDHFSFKTKILVCTIFPIGLLAPFFLFLDRNYYFCLGLLLFCLVGYVILMVFYLLKVERKVFVEKHRFDLSKTKPYLVILTIRYRFIEKRLGKRKLRSRYWMTKAIAGCENLAKRYEIKVYFPWVGFSSFLLVVVAFVLGFYSKELSVEKDVLWIAALLIQAGFMICMLIGQWRSVYCEFLWSWVNTEAFNALGLKEVLETIDLERG